jgi:pimeloyl-ACP methyl ester carboxylesterase
MSEIKLRSDPAKLKNIHVLFIHGLGGDADNTWLERDSKEQSWPLWLLEDSDELNIWSIEYSAPKFKFNNSGMGIPDHATNILEHILKITELSEGEIIFVSHSLGGLITKQILRIANDQTARAAAQEFLGRISGVAFLATPHLGSDISSLGNQLIPRVIMRGLALLKPSIAAASLSRNDPYLRELNTWYREWVSSRIIRHLVLTETESMYGVIDVVKQDSADPGLDGVRAIPIEASHENICKPVNKEDDIYIQVKGFVTQKKRANHEIWLTSRFASNVNSWEGYDNWAKCPSGISEEYLVDDKVRLIDSSSQNSEGLNGVEGINYLRQKLLRNNSSIRLIGLSGVGKTRFAQALFDTRIGENLISTESIFYTDIANGPSPNPRVLAEKLVSEGKDAQLIVDNCPPELHRTLTSLCTSDTSKVNLLTIEYDIREDQPEQTDVFSLEPSSIELIEKILNSRYRNLGQQNSRTISEFSGGNSRIAIALAETIEKDENISSLKDEELFKRLFYQRHDQDKSLEKTAQALSLVYSFQINSDNPYSEDVNFISNLSEIPAKNIYQAAIELKRRNLVQQRSKWMAVLPHPIANRLAKYALENISSAIILSNFSEATDERLLKSFSRRLGYLTQCDEAKVIVSNWLSDNGLVHNLYAQGKNELAWILINNIAPISTKEVLVHIETLAKQPEFCTRNNKQFTKITRLIRSIAYEKQYFDQCAKLLCQFALSENKGENNNSNRDILKSLFQLYLSGTHATKEQRLNIINALIESEIQSNVDLALELLCSSLEAWHFSSSHSFDFGANPRDFGYRPRTNQDVKNWYEVFIDYTAKLIAGGPQVSSSAKKVLSKNLRSLWGVSSLRDIIEKICKEISKSGMWSDGFEAIHSILRFDCSSSNEDDIQRLKSISEVLSPNSLLDDIDMYVLAEPWKFYDLEEMDDNGKVIECGHKKGYEYSIELGIQLANRPQKVLEDILFKLLSYPEISSNLFAFGKGYAEGIKNHSEVLTIIIGALEKLSEKERNLDFLRGQIYYLSKNNIALTNYFLDSLLIHPTLKQHFIRVQLSYTIDTESITRIIQALQENACLTWEYNGLASGRRHEPIPDESLCEILDFIWQKEGGQDVAIHILSMRFHGLKQNKNYIVSDLLKEKSASLLALFDYSEERGPLGGSDHSLTQIANVCFPAGTNEEYLLTILKKIKSRILEHIIGSHHFPDFISTIIQLHPTIALGVFIAEDTEVSCQIKNAIKGKFDRKTSLFSKIDIQCTLAWCEEVPHSRYSALASMITPYQTIEKSIEWTPLAIGLLDNAPEPIKVLDEYLSNLSPSGWTGSRAKILESRLPLFQSLINFDNNEISAWVTDKEVQWKKFIASEYEREIERDIDSNERFEW